MADNIKILERNSNPSAMDLSAYQVIIYDRVVFQLNPQDTTSAPDNIRVIVDNEGNRFRSKESPRVINVKGSTSATNPNPPSNPAPGDKWVIFGGSGGLFAGFIEHIAIWTRWEWDYELPVVGQIIFNEATNSFWHFTAIGIWQEGFGSESLLAQSIPPNSLRQQVISVSNRLPAPPSRIVSNSGILVSSNPTAGTGYASVANNVVWYDNNSNPQYIPPYQGMLIYLQGTGYLVWENGWRNLREDARYYNDYYITSHTNSYSNAGFGDRTGWRLNPAIPNTLNANDLFIWRIFQSGTIQPQFTATVRRTTGSKAQNSEKLSFDLGIRIGDTNSLLRPLVSSQEVTARKMGDGSDAYYEYSGDIVFPTFDDGKQRDGFFPIPSASSDVQLVIRPTLAAYAPHGSNAVTASNWGALLQLESQVF